MVSVGWVLSCGETGQQKAGKVAEARNCEIISSTTHQKHNTSGWEKDSTVNSWILFPVAYSGRLLKVSKSPLRAPPTQCLSLPGGGGHLLFKPLQSQSYKKDSQMWQRAGFQIPYVWFLNDAKTTIKSRKLRVYNALTHHHLGIQVFGDSLVDIFWLQG